MLKVTLLVIMHNDEKYLQQVLSIMKKENIIDVAVIEKKNLGLGILGHPTYTTNLGWDGKLLSPKPRYNRAVVSVVKDMDKVNHILKLINKDKTIQLLNSDPTGYVCTIPFDRIVELHMKSVRRKRNGRIE